MISPHEIGLTEEDLDLSGVSGDYVVVTDPRSVGLLDLGDKLRGTPERTDVGATGIATGHLALDGTVVNQTLTSVVIPPVELPKRIGEF